MTHKPEDCLILFGFAQDSPAPFPPGSMSLRDLSPGYSETLENSKLSQASISALKLAVVQVIRALVQQNKRSVVIFFGEKEAASNFFVLAQIRTALPDIRIFMAGTGLSTFHVTRKLAQGLIDVSIRSDDLPTILDCKKRLKTGASLASDPRIFWKSEENWIRWNRPEPGPPKLGTVLLVIMPAWNEEFPPYGLAHLSASLKAAGYGVKVLDLNLEFWRTQRKEEADIVSLQNIVLWSLPERFESGPKPRLVGILETLERTLKSEEFCAVGFSLFQTNLLASDEGFRVVRKVSPKTRIICGGPSCTPEWSKQALADGNTGNVDAAVFGEADTSLIELLHQWDKENPEPVKGVRFRGLRGTLLEGGAREPECLALCQNPDFSELPVFNYSRLVLPVHFSRGCVGKCAFCFESFYWKKHRSVPFNKVLEMIANAQRDYGVNHFMVADSLMNGDHAALGQLADALIDSGMNVSFYGYCRADQRLTPELLAKLKEAGCSEIFFGIESGSQRVLNRMRKGIRLTHAAKVLRNTKTVGIRSCVSIMVGFPGETWWDFWKSAYFVLKNSRYFDNLVLNIAAPPEGTPMFQERDSFDIEFRDTHSRFWKSKDGRNTLDVRLLRHRIILRLWQALRGRWANAAIWDLEYETLRE